MTINSVLKGSWPGPWAMGVLCVLVLLFMLPQEAPAPTAVEYAVMLALIIVVCITDISAVSLPPGSRVVSSQLLTAGNDAATANDEGDRPKEIGRLSKVIGAAEALMGMSSSCEGCDELRNNLQQIIGLAAFLKGNALASAGGGGRCDPDGFIQRTEQCDPLAVPTGCPVTTTLTFCSEDCRCQPAVLVP